MTSISTIDTVGINEIFDVYVAYGICESLIRGGVEDFELIPLGSRYRIICHYQNNVVNKALYDGLKDSLEEMLAFHEAMRFDIRSEADFSLGVNINYDYYYLSNILEALKNVKNTPTQSKQHITIPLPLMPTAGRYLPRHFGVIGGNPIKIDERNYALAWIGFYFYTPYIRYSREDKTYVHIYPIIPLETLTAIEVLALKDLKERRPHYAPVGNKSKNFMNSSKLVLLYHLARIESIGAIEVLTKKTFSLRAYTLIREGNNQSARYFDTQNIGNLMNFLYILKRKSLYKTIIFIDDILNKLDSEAATYLVDAVLFDEVEGFYRALRIARREGIKIPERIVDGIMEYIENRQKY